MLPNACAVLPCARRKPISQRNQICLYGLGQEPYLLKTAQSTHQIGTTHQALHVTSACFKAPLLSSVPPVPVIYLTFKAVFQNLRTRFGMETIRVGLPALGVLRVSCHLIRVTDLLLVTVSTKTHVYLFTSSALQP